MSSLHKDITALSEQQAEAQTETPAINPQKASNDLLIQKITKEQKNVTVDFTNLPLGAQVSGDSSSIGKVTPAVSSTMHQ